MKEPVLSYIIATKNKLPLLRKTMPQLLTNTQEVEEIIVIDGASTDGSNEFLNSLYKQGKIDYFISEPDKGEAHALNKALFVSKGRLIKFITDDDAYYYPGIRKCRQFMLNHAEVDILGTNGAGTDWSSINPFVLFGKEYNHKYRLWQKTGQPFSFCGLGLMLRRSSLPLTGLFNTAFTRIDAEFTMRITSGNKVNLAWYTGNIYVRIVNPQSISVVNDFEVIEETETFDLFYQKNRSARYSRDIMNHPHNKLTFSRFFDTVKQKIKRQQLRKNQGISSGNRWYENRADSWELANSWLFRINKEYSGKFLFR